MPRSIKKILCATDLSEESLPAEKYAYELASMLGALITFVHVDPTPLILSTYLTYTGPLYPGDKVLSYAQRISRQKTEQLKSRLDTFDSQNKAVVETRVLVGYPSDEILGAVNAKDNAYDLLVIAKKHRSIVADFLLGSIATRLIEESRIPTLVVPSNWTESLSTGQLICVGTTLGPVLTPSEEIAQSISQKMDAQIEILNVLEDLDVTRSIDSLREDSDLFEEIRDSVEHEQRYRVMALQERANEIAGKSGIKARGTLLRGSVAHTLLQHSKAINAKLFVLGNHFQNLRSVSGILFGSSVRTLVQKLDCPVIIVPTNQ